MRTRPSRALARVGRNGPAPSVLSNEAAAYAEQSRAVATRRAYLHDTGRFASWCAARALPSVPASAETLANYLSWMATSGFKVATIERNIVAISVAHRQLGFDSPRRYELVREVLRGVRRSLGIAPARKRALVTADLLAMLAVAPRGMKGARDRAILALAFSGALRRNELVALNVPDLEFSREGLRLKIRRSKTDQEGKGASIAVPRGRSLESCPVRLVRTWMETAGLTKGPLFRSVDRHGRVSGRRLSGKAVASVTKGLAEKIGIDPATVGAHSLRAGLVTSAIRSGKAEHAVMKHTRHKSVTAFRVYIREADLFASNVATGLGL